MIIFEDCERVIDNFICSHSCAHDTMANTNVRVGVRGGPSFALLSWQQIKNPLAPPERVCCKTLLFARWLYSTKTHRTLTAKSMTQPTALANLTYTTRGMLPHRAYSHTLVGQHGPFVHVHCPRQVRPRRESVAGEAAKEHACPVTIWIRGEAEHVMLVELFFRTRIPQLSFTP